MKVYRKYIRKYWYYFLLAPLFTIIEASGEFVLPFLSANIINNGAAYHDSNYVITYSIYMGLIAIGMLITGILGAYFGVCASVRLAEDMRLDTFMKIQKFSFKNIDEFTTGSLITRMTNDIAQIQGFTERLLRGFFRGPVMIIGALVMSFILEPTVGYIILAIVPLLALVISLVMVISQPRYTKMQEQIDKLNIDVNESISNQKVIKSFVRDDYETSKFDVVNNELKRRSTKALRLMLLMQPITTGLLNVGTIAMVWFAGRRVMVGELEVGTLTAFVTYLTQVSVALNFISNIILAGTRAKASSKRVKEVLKADIDLTDDFSKHKDKIIESGSIEFKNVSFKYFKNNKENVLQDISFKIESGEFIGIIGSTGCGKSTLISLIPRLYDVDLGSILVDGVDVKELSLHELRDKVSLVLQKNTLFSGTIKENLLWGNEDAKEEDLLHATKVAQAYPFIQSFKDGFETSLEQGGQNLSGGQRQRLCIARALVKKPKILILDDSTSAVDTQTDAKIRKAFQEEMPGVTKLVIAQRINSVIDADKIIVLDSGKITGIGNHKDLLATCKEYQEIYYSQKDKEVA